MAKLDAMDDPKKATQVPPGDISDAVGKHNESDFNDADSDDDTEPDPDAEDTSDFD
jgi:hypothetical protein